MSETRPRLLFFASFSFQSNLIGWIYLATKNQRLGEWSAIYLSFVISVWFFFLGGAESSINEYIFNVILHYIQPLIVLLYWIHRNEPSNTPILLEIYPLFYLIFIIQLNNHLGYEMYPVIREPVFWLGFILLFSAFKFGRKTGK